MTPPRSPTAALLGNPNTGKTTLFNALTGLSQRTGNYPGVTVELKHGRAGLNGRSVELVDLPGTYSLAPRSIDEMVAVDTLMGRQPGEPRPDVIVNIVDASNLDRHLYLTTQALETGIPVVVALNMIDVADAQGVRIDDEALAERLGARVVRVQANKGAGLDKLTAAVLAAAADAPRTATGPSFPPAFEAEVNTLAAVLPAGTPRFLARRLLLDTGGHVERVFTEAHGATLGDKVRAARERLAAADCRVPAVEARARYGWIRKATAGCVAAPVQRPASWTDRIDRVLTHKLWGSLAFLALMFLMFLAVFSWAEPAKAVLETGQAFLANAVRSALPEGPLASLLADGVIGGVGAVVVFVPQILILFAFIAVLEDCGYMARAAFLMDRLMARCGLNGKSFIPLLSSLACAIPGVMAARVIENRRDRLATILVAPLMSCSARLPLYVLLVGAFFGDSALLAGAMMFGMYMIGFVAAPLVALALKGTLLRGPAPVFVLEMPSYKWPSLGTVLRRVFDSGWSFLRRAGTLILAAMVLVWALQYFPAHAADGTPYESQISKLDGEREGLEQTAKDAGREPTAEEQARVEELAKESNRLNGEWKSGSYLGQVGHALEPVFAPLGWDWRTGTAALASFPAREVVVGTLGLLYDEGNVDPGAVQEEGLIGQGEGLGGRLRDEWSGDGLGRVRALSLLVFFALCCQCAPTLVVIKRETNSWGWPAFTFFYMTGLAYLGALVTFQVGRLFVG